MISCLFATRANKQDLQKAGPLGCPCFRSATIADHGSLRHVVTSPRSLRHPSFRCAPHAGCAVRSRQLRHSRRLGPPAVADCNLRLHSRVGGGCMEGNCGPAHASRIRCWGRGLRGNPNRVSSASSRHRWRHTSWANSRFVFAVIDCEFHRRMARNHSEEIRRSATALTTGTR